MNVFTFHRTIKIRLAESFISSTIGGMIFPFMAIYLSHYFGMKTTGLLLLLNVFACILFNFLSGYLSDHFGRKKAIVLAETLRFLAFSLMMLANSPWFSSPLLTFFMMMINSVCWGLAGPANQAMLIDVSKPEERKLMYTIMYWTNNLSIAIGGIAGGFLFQHYLFELLIALSIAAFAAWVLIVFFIEESHAPKKVQKRSAAMHTISILKGYKEVLKDRIFVLYVLAGLLVLSMEFQLTNYISIRLNNELPVQHILNWTFGGTEMIGFLRTENTILVVVTALFAARIVEKFKESTTLIVSCMIFVAGYAVISYSNNMWILFLAMLAATVAEVLRVPVEQNYMANLPSADARSSYMAVAGLTFNLAMLICSVTVTLSAFLSSFSSTVFITLIGVIGIILYYRILPDLTIRTSASEQLQVKAE
ncbi:MDR family MFS transporter [Metabacillus sp. RGM 3146]|uniref:MDR family MFS transporter n=1 Tax=Metabacillus sp. RGM 3146 TaxID=3401092 RepID=UPI003B9B699B